MFGSEVLDVAIGLVFIYLVLSLICSAACELIESFLKRRAVYLERGLKQLLNDPEGSGLVKEIYSHPLIASLYAGKYDPASKGNLPAYIPPASFSLALMDIVGLCGPGANSTPSPVSLLPAGVKPPPEWVRSTIQTNASFSPHVCQALLAMADAAGYDPAQIRKSIEAWYNSSMDRVSGWFKRHSHFVVLSVGLALSLAINADTISITNSLATGKALRESLVSAASEAAKLPPAASGTDITDVKTGDAFQADLDQIRGAGLPLGWSTSHFPKRPLDWAIKMFGIVLTGLAVSLGGPFWFDVLNRFMVVRSTVKPSEKSPQEDSKS